MIGVIKRYFWWMTLTMISIWLINSNQASAPSLLRERLSDVVTIGGMPINSVIRVIELWKENRILRKTLAERVIQSAQLEELQNENDRLRQMMDFRLRSSFNLTAASVTGLTTDAGVVGLLIDRGSVNGVAVNMAVVSTDGLVGRIYRVSEFSSVVQLLTDPNLGVTASLANSGESGIIHTAGLKKLRLDGVPSTAELVVGDSVFTSGVGGIFPPNILIGWTSAIVPSSEGWLLSIEIKPAVDYTRLHEVFIIRQIFN